MDKITVLMIGITETAGGVESYIMNLYRNIDRSKFQFYFIKRRNSKLAYESEIENLGGIIIENCPSRHDVFDYYRFYKSLFKKIRFDAVYYNTCDIMSMDFLIFAKKANVRIRIIHAHSTKNMIEQNFYHKISEKWCRKHLHKYANCYFACSKNAGNWMFNDIDYKIIPNGIDISKYHFNIKKRLKCRKELGINEEKLISCVGRLSETKNLFFAIDIEEQLIEIEPQAKLVLIGAGELENELKNLVIEKGLQDKVIFTGAVDNVYEWMSAIDCLIMPSLFEGLPFVLVEAQAAGLKCIVSSNVSNEANITGLVEYLDLEEGAKKWAERALISCDEERINVDQKLIDKGYSIQTTANTISKMIENSLIKKYENINSRKIAE